MKLYHLRKEGGEHLPGINYCPYRPNCYSISLLAPVRWFSILVWYHKGIAGKRHFRVRVLSKRREERINAWLLGEKE